MAPEIVIVGGGMGGLRAAEQLRAAGWTGAITVVGAEAHPPYNRPPLSKEALAEAAAGRGSVEETHRALRFRPRSSTADVRWSLGVPVTDAHLGERCLELADGTELAYDGLVVATGVRPRRLDVPGPEGGRFAVRTLDDCLRLGAALRPGAEVVVIGAGFVGCEVAATARGLGCGVTVVEPMSAPLERVFGGAVGGAVRRLLEDLGVGFRMGRTVVEFLARTEDSAQVSGVLLDDGTDCAADVVVEAVGSLPNTEWLRGNRLDLSDGVACDNWLRVGNRADVVAVGDVAGFPNPRFDEVPRRVEHWTMPGETARRAARTLAVGLAGCEPADVPFRPLPSFWSDVADVRLQSFGLPALGERIEVLEGSLRGDRALAEGTAVAYYHGDQPVGMLLANVPASRHSHYHALVDTSGRRISAFPGLTAPQEVAP